MTTSTALTRLAALTCAAALAACGTKERAEGAATAKPAEAAQPAAPAALAAGEATPAVGAATPAAADGRACDAPCLLLATTPLADAPAAFQKACGKEWAATSPTDCDQLDYQRNCVYAAAGQTFKREKYRAAFAAQPWYAPRADFKPSDLSAVAVANVAQLKQQAAACRAGAPVSADDRKRVDAWIAGLAAGKPELPALGFEGIERLTAEQLRANLVQNKALYAKSKVRSIAYAQPSDAAKQALPGKQLRAIEINVSEQLTGACEDEEADGCDSGLFVTLVYDDRDQLVAVEIFGAG